MTSVASALRRKNNPLRRKDDPFMWKDDGTEIACALCGTRETRRLYTKWKWGIERCRRWRLWPPRRIPESDSQRRRRRQSAWPLAQTVRLRREPPSSTPTLGSVE